MKGEVHQTQAGGVPGTFQGSNENITYSETTSIAREWQFRQDYLAWYPSASPPEVPSTNSTTPLDGRMWLHGESDIGQFTNDLGTGFRVKVSAGVESVNSSYKAELANFYQYVTPDEPYSKARSKPRILTKYKVIHRLWPLDLPRPPTLGDNVATRENAMVLEGTTTQTFGLLQRDGLLDLQTGSTVSSALRADWSSSALLWENAVETRLNIGRLVETAGYHGVSFRSDGTDVVSAAVDSGGTLSRASLTAASTKPPAREDFRAAYSRYEQTAFIVGGRNPATGSERQDVWFRGLGTGSAATWTQSPLSEYAPNRVIAATWSWLDQRLWILVDGRPEARVSEGPGCGQVVGRRCAVGP